MNLSKISRGVCLYFIAAAFSLPAFSIPELRSSPSQETSAQTATKRVIGAITAISGQTITLAPSAGSEVVVAVDASTRMRRVAPGEKNLQNAAVVELKDLQVGDRVLVGGKLSDDGKSIEASSIVVMSRSDLEAKQEKDRQEWQKRGMGGLVSGVDASSGTVTISVAGMGGSKTVSVKTSKSTIIRRYASDSIKFDDAKPSTLQEIKIGDQLRVRGDRNADGSEEAAEEIVTGSFRNIAGTVITADATSGTLSVQDLLSKKPVQVKIAGDSQLHKLPADMAQRMALRLKASPGGGPNSGAAPQAAVGAQGSPSAAAGGGGTAGGLGGRGGAPDLNQMLNRMPTVALTDLHKGDAVLIVATEGSSGAAGVAVTLVSGVEPILQAAPSASQAMMLTPWSLGGSSGEAASQ